MSEAKNITERLNEILAKGKEPVRFIPPDSDDVRWYSGSETFTRGEVAAILWSQIAKIGNDLKTHCGKDLTAEMYEIIDNPRIPEF